METKLLPESQIATASEIIKSGGLVAFRTETVYGLGASATDEEATKKIFIAKGRPSDNPLIVHFSSMKMLSEYFDLDELQTKLLSIPSLTLLLPYNKFKLPLAKQVTGGNPNVAVRIPCCRFTKKFITACGVPIAAPSANTSTRPSPTTWQAVHEDLDGKIDAILKGSPTKRGVESTVVNIENNILYILRHGAVSEQALKELTGFEVKFNIASKESPGTNYLHYAPAVPMYLATDTKGIPDMVIRIHKFSKKTPVVVIAQSSHKDFFDLPIILLGKRKKKIYKKFYSAIRKAEKLAMQMSPDAVIVIEDLPHNEQFQTLHDRISKATEGRTI